mgnify:FL=1
MKALLVVLAAIVAMPAVAQVYSCPDGRGGKIYQQRPCSGQSSGYIRCVKPNGDSYVHLGISCPVRRERVEHQAGMVTDVRTGQQHFMVPGGCNGMIDPRTGQRHELISPPPTRRTQDYAQPISQENACSQARADRDRALSDFNRTMNTIRAAEARYERLCGR